MNRRIVFIILVLYMALFIRVSQGEEGRYPPGAGKGALTQYGTIDALMQGIYDGELRLDQLSAYGDFGLGTFNALDGEMIVLDGVVYRAAYDGTVTIMGDDEKTPFAAVTFFDPDTSVGVPSGLDFEAFQRHLTLSLPSPNLCYAIRMDGFFPMVKVRSVDRQKPPYPPLAEAVKRQSVFEFKEVRGTLLGYYMPYYGNHLNVPGYHFHFITADRDAGGHVLEMSTGEHTVQLDTLYTFTTLLPGTVPFLQSTRPKETSLAGVE